MYHTINQNILLQNPEIKLVINGMKKITRNESSSPMICPKKSELCSACVRQDSLPINLWEERNMKASQMIWRFNDLGMQGQLRQCIPETIGVSHIFGRLDPVLLFFVWEENWMWLSYPIRTWWFNCWIAKPNKLSLFEKDIWRNVPFKSSFFSNRSYCSKLDSFLGFQSGQSFWSHAIATLKPTRIKRYHVDTSAYHRHNPCPYTYSTTSATHNHKYILIYHEK